MNAPCPSIGAPPGDAPELPPQPSHQLRVLLVESDDDQALMVRECLTAARVNGGTTCDRARSAPDAMRQMSLHAYDVLLIDSRLRADGALSLLGRVRSRGIDVPAILLTNGRSQEIAAEALKAGAADSLPKSKLGPASLGAAIRYALELHRSRAAQVQADEALRQTEARYRRVFDQALIGNYITTPGGRILACNAAFAGILGFDSVADALAARAYHFYPDAPARDSMLERLRESGRLDRFEETLRRRDGRPVEVMMNTIAIRDAAGAVVEMQGSILDITDRKRTEKDLVESTRFNAEIIASVHEVIAVIDRDMRFALWNRFAERSMGIPSKEVLGRRVLEVFPAVAEQGVDALLRRALAGESVTMPDIPVQLPGSDRVVWTAGTLVPRRNADGEIVGVIAAVHDVTERRRADEALRRSEDQLRHSQKMEAVGRLAGGVAHDFNNLLGVITGYSELLLREANPDHPATRRVEQIHSAAEKAAGLTRQLLAFSRRQVLEPKVVSLNAVVGGAVKMLSRLLGENVETTVSLDPDLDLVKADPGQIEQVLMNLAVNARDAMPGGGRLVIETANVVLNDAYTQGHAGVSPGPHVLVAVSDTGSGMDEETRSRIFEPFFTTKELGKGTGLGLSTVYGIVKQSGGHVTVYSEPGLGSTFRVYLPSVEEDATPIRADLARVPLPTGTGAILLVEDEASLRAIIGETLRGAGYDITEAATPADALAGVRDRRERCDLLITDVVMPGMSGRDLACALTEAQPGIKVLFMSGYTDDSIVHHGVLEPGVEFLSKPFTAHALAQKVRELLGTA